MQTKILNNWLSEDLSNFLEQKFLHFTPHFYREVSIDGGDIFYSFTFSLEDPLTNFLMYKLQKTMKVNLHFKRIYINVQHPNMNGSYHTDDDSEQTCLYMVTGEGDFEIKKEGKIKFEKNKLIIFDSQKLHRGLAPSKGVRITLAFKTNKII